MNKYNSTYTKLTSDLVKEIRDNYLECLRNTAGSLGMKTTDYEKMLVKKYNTSQHQAEMCIKGYHPLDMVYVREMRRLKGMYRGPNTTPYAGETPRPSEASRNAPRHTKQHIVPVRTDRSS